MDESQAEAEEEGRVFHLPSRSPSADSSAGGSNKPRKPRPESGLVSFDDIMNASHDMPPPKEPV